MSETTRNEQNTNLLKPTNTNNFKIDNLRQLARKSRGKAKKNVA